MESRTKLRLIKFVHTLIWIFFNAVIFYLLYGAVTGKLDLWLWIAYAVIMSEVIILMIFKLSCPLTVIARKYSNSSKENFDIYLPNWLAKYNKLIYTPLVITAIIITVYRLLG